MNHKFNVASTGALFFLLTCNLGFADERSFGSDLILDCQERNANSFGPFDYTNPQHVKNHLKVVERHHFAPQVERLISGQNGLPDPWEDIIYVLRAFPNHHRALYAMSRYLQRSESPPAPGARNSADCWFHEAMKIAPQDAMIYTIYALHLHKTRRVEESLERYQQSLRLAPDSVDTHYNLGLLYFDLHNYELSLEHAQVAYRLGHPLPGLREKLARAGKWRKGTQ